MGYRAKKQWLERTIITGAQARIKNGWAKATPEKRIVEIRCYRIRLMDHDGAATSIKPILDGCKNLLRRREKGMRTTMLVPGAALVYDDSPEYVELVSPGNLQVRVHSHAEERTEVTIRLLPHKPDGC